MSLIPSVTTAPGRPPRVLVVDDDPHIRRLIIASLRRDHYDFIEAANGRPALEAMRRGEVDVVILDLMMPEVSGWDVLEARVHDEKMMRIPVVVISANREPQVALAFTQGIAAFLPKPFDINALNALVRSCISQAAAAAGNEPTN